ncbi:MAG: hypothetical protein J6033_05340 [Lachnospiraceae bacterium]|nr:hypothetical protein [Lachnospiraceae bacterium]
MNVNGITSAQQNAYSYKAETTKTEKKAIESTAKDNGVIYEASKENVVEKKTYSPNAELIAKLKSDADARAMQLRNLVEKAILGQAGVFSSEEDYLRVLASGKFTVDEATRAQAQKDISEDGFWGVKQTSDRILQFATAITGGDPDKIQEMYDAFKKGFDQAKKAWGGELPEISGKTFDAVTEKFKKLAEDNGITLDY